jgi:DNA-directed RNA polymerase
LGRVPLRIDGAALDLVRHCAPDIKEYPPDDDRRNADLLRIVHETETAARLFRRGVFFNTYGICFRGRMVPEHAFNYQLGDRVRSLFRFAKPVSLNSEGLRWLMIHAANCFGIDKVSYDARVAWVDKNYSDFIVPIAESPEQHFDAWRDCDKPFAFVSACRELLEAERKHETTLPCAFDHTASGLQHLALIGLDTKTADLVNLTPRDAPSDVYGVLANQTVRLFDNSEAAHYWREFFKTTAARKLLKQPGLSFSYAATLDGNVDQVQEAFYKLRHPEPEFEHVLYLVQHFRAACKEMLTGPAETMDYLQSLVSECTKAKRFLEWPTSNGLLVGNEYTKFKPRTIYCPGGSEHDINEAIPGTIDGRQARNSIAANFVHSLDAAHLVRTVNALALNEMPALCVHDCFAVYASHAGQFHITNREELASMYADFHERGGPLELLRSHNGLASKPPERGAFEIWKNVQQAQYACS